MVSVNLHSENENKNHDQVQKGIWEPIQYRFRHLPVHIALLHTGKVLAFGGSGNDETHLNTPYPSEIFEPYYDDRTNITSSTDHHNNRIYEIPNTGIAGDIFCSGHAFLADGRLIVAGGMYKYDGSLLRLPIPPFSVPVTEILSDFSILVYGPCK